jgi:hypothetical protein
MAAHNITSCAYGAWVSWAAGLLGYTQSFPALPAHVLLLVEGALKGTTVEGAAAGGKMELTGCSRGRQLQIPVNGITSHLLQGFRQLLSRHLNTE